MKGVVHYMHVDLALGEDELIAVLAQSMIETLAEFLALDVRPDAQDEQS